MTRTSGEQPFFNNYGAGTHEQMMTEVPSAFNPGGGLGSLGMSEHATYSENQTTSIHSTHQRNGPSFPYPNFASPARQTTLSTSPTFPVATESYHVSTPDQRSQPPYYQQGAGWEQQQQQQQQLPSTSAAALCNRELPAVSAPPGLTPYEFAPSHDISDSYLGGGSTYGSPPVLQNPVQPGFGFSWTNGYPPNSLGPNTPSQEAIASPTARTFGSISAPSETGFSDNSDSVTYGASQQQQLQPQQQPQQHRWVQTTAESIEGNNKPEDGALDNGGKMASSSQSQIVTPMSRGSPFNAGAATVPPVPGIPGSSGAVKTSKPQSAPAIMSKNKGKLRSASRAPKNIQPRPEETAEERKSRNSHNLVEKQYRNRLNAQFESLLAVLPDSLRSSMTMIGGGPGGESDGVNGGSVIPGQHPSLDFSIERRLSKAEVLDMSRRYILSLEKERDTLEREKVQLMRNIDQLRHGQHGQGHIQHHSQIPHGIQHAHHGIPGQHHGGHVSAPGAGAAGMYMVDRNGIPIGHHGHMRGVGG